VSWQCDDTFLAHECADCKEIMPTYELVCYCGGPVCMVDVQMCEKPLVQAYGRRELLYLLRERDRQNGN